MGIRIHKILGYGLVDLEHSKGEVVDSRIDPKGFFAADWEDKEEKWTLEGYEIWLQDQIAALTKSVAADDRLGQWRLSEYKMEKHMVKEKIKENDHSIMDCIVSDQEFGLPNVLCIVPLDHLKQWHRYDDPIDYQEETYSRKGQRNRVKVFEHGIYPYNCNYCDSRTQRRLDPAIVSFAKRYAADDRRDGPTLLKICKKELGYKSVEDFLKYTRSQVPYSIQMLCEYTKIFKKKSTIYTLVPMLYVYWS